MNLFVKLILHGFISVLFIMYNINKLYYHKTRFQILEI